MFIIRIHYYAIKLNILVLNLYLLRTVSHTGLGHKNYTEISLKYLK